MTWSARLDGDLKDKGLRRVYEGCGAEARYGNEPREVEVWHHGENV